MKRDYIDDFNNHQEKAWKYFYADYYSVMCSYAFRITKDGYDAEDIVQATFIKLWESERNFASMRELSWYLYKSVYLNALNHIQRKELHSRLLTKVVIAEATIPDEDFVHAVRQLRNSVEHLPKEARKILMLSLDGLPSLEISQKLNISINTVKSQKKRSFSSLCLMMQKFDLLLLFCTMLYLFIFLHSFTPLTDLMYYI